MTTSTPTSALSHFQISESGVLVQESDTPVLVLSVDGQYVWSFTPARDGHPADGGTLVPWPEVLHRFLDGTAVFTIADYEGEVLYEERVPLGSGEGEISIVDKSGHPLSVDKVGHLARSFEATDEKIRDEILDGTRRALADLRDHAGVEAYLNYGALLGAVREGRMLGHDSDTDLCYLSEHTFPADVIRESYAVERVMRARGWNLVRMSGGDIKLFLPLSDGRQCQIDVFVAFYVPDAIGAGPFFQLGNRSGDLPREAIVPLSTIELHGYEFPAPADPEAMLAFLYGPHWRTPDPSFKYEDPPAGVRRLDGWLRGFRNNVQEWNELYATRGKELRSEPSSFVRWVAGQLPEGAKVVDVGAGAIGRDRRFLAESGHPVHSVDYTHTATASARRQANRTKLPITTEVINLGDARAVLYLGAVLSRDPHHLYARDLLGSLNPAARAHLWTLARMALRPTGAKLYAEFAVTGEGLDAPEPRGLVRRLDLDVVRTEIAAAGGGVESVDLVDSEDVFGNPVPQVARLRASWPTPHLTKETQNHV